MQMGRIFDIMAAIVSIAGLTVLVTSTNTASIISAFGNTFTGSLKAAMGH